MQCKNHPNRHAQYFCKGCGIPLCTDCTEEVKPGENYCFQCAMSFSLSAVGNTIGDKREKAAIKKAKKKSKKWSSFHYFVLISSILIISMWSFIIFGAQEPPKGAAQVTENDRAFLFMVDASIKRYAHYEMGEFPLKLSELVPKYLAFSEGELVYLLRFSYSVDRKTGYQLFIKNPEPGEMKLILTAKGIIFDSLSTDGV